MSVMVEQVWMRGLLMPHPIPLPLRHVILQRAKQGQNATLIARSLNLVCRTVRHLLQRVRVEGEEAVAPAYPSRTYPHTRQFRALVEEALKLRRKHPTWGAGLVRVVLHRRHPAQPLPAERTLQRWFVRAGLAAAPSGRRSQMSSQRAPQPHAIWQMDAADQVALRDGMQVCWLRIVDECSGALLETAVFPPGLLEHRCGWPRAGRLAPGFPTLGKTRGLSRGQRHALGIDRRFAYRSDVVVAGTGHCRHLQCAPLSPAKRCRGTFARHGQALG